MMDSQSFMEERLVHLDLKGAPPHTSYLQQIFPMIQRWGATGILIEYEDMFPYWGDLEVIASPHAYSRDQIIQIHALATQSGLKVIPLVQTFGHFEFVLKHDRFKELREVPSHPMALCPQQAGSLTLVQEMIDQVLQLHPHSQWFHIGADEVFHLGLCSLCQSAMKQEHLEPVQLFFKHIKSVLSYLKKVYGHIDLIMWDDMFRTTELRLIQGSGICDLVEPMIWCYFREVSLPDDIWDRYSQTFPQIWIASAFKGATGPCAFLTDISYHLDNHSSWLQIIQCHGKRFRCVRGCAVTGWQRYDHFAILCELLPAGLPCLALCLMLLSKGKLDLDKELNNPFKNWSIKRGSIIPFGSFTKEIHSMASRDMNFSGEIPLCPFKMTNKLPQCSFPGSGVYIGMHIFLYLSIEYDNFTRNDRLNAWMSDYHVKNNYCNPAHIQHFLPMAQQLLNQLQLYSLDVNNALREVFSNATADEWIMTNVSPKIEKLNEIISKANYLLAGGCRAIPSNMIKTTH